MNIILNGQPKDIAPASCLGSLIEHLARKPELVIAELNGTIIDRSAWDRTQFKTGDKVELITFVGGG